MPVLNRVAETAEEIATWRRELHTFPELMFDLPRTSAYVAEKLKSFGCDEVVTGIGRSGVVAVIKGRASGKGQVIGLRADMDALPILEDTGLPYASQNTGKMHACGHDGHTAMLLGAARHLAETRAFAGTVVLIFQPAEEGEGGARVMIEDGLLERFKPQEIYGMHNQPGIPLGEFALRPGAIMASTDRLEIFIDGRGAHAAKPHQGVDPVLVGSAIVMGLQQVVARNVDPLESAVVSITMFHAGAVENVIPATAQLTGTARTLKASVRKMLQERLPAIVEGIASAYGATAQLKWIDGYPVTVNHAEQAAFAAKVAADVAGTDKVDTNIAPMMGAEDFSFMLEARPGAFIFVGNGQSAGLHNPHYNFNDEAIPFGTSYWVRLVETAMPL
ncbi:amidohydrolase [Azorhizobium oxalatiphilum]|uniref:Amidohydrolase n=1 Tax=Azorhizobium oxalatiphilum TaxID=980631 RepID=A0A917FAB2_9HYPH|nr:M20 aminoacylase family protein [Azorhizobium oxalatiphilum]GGF59493.1 amidohydrolase [Azorhizobium oxalatiphilum]